MSQLRQDCWTDFKWSHLSSSYSTFTPVVSGVRPPPNPLPPHHHLTLDPSYPTSPVVAVILLTFPPRLITYISRCVQISAHVCWKLKIKVFIWVLATSWTMYKWRVERQNIWEYSSSLTKVQVTVYYIYMQPESHCIHIYLPVPKKKFELSFGELGALEGWYWDPKQTIFKFIDP